MALEVRDRINDLPELETVDGAVNLVGQTTGDQTGRFALDRVTAIARSYVDAIVTDLSGSLVTAGTGDDYTVISARTLPVIADGFTIAFRADRTNTTTAPTLRVSGGSVIPFAKRGNAAPAIGDIEAGAIYVASYVAADAAFLLHHVPMADMAPLASPALTGTPTVPTAAPGTNTTQAASTAFVAAAIAALLASAPASLDTLNELATALGNDPNFATTMVNALALKAPLASPALTGTPTAPTPTAGDNSTKLSTTAFVQAAVAATLANLVTPQNYLSGLTLSTAGSSSSFGIAAGVATDSANTGMMSLASSYTKTTGAWAVGSGNGALDTGTIASNTWYHIFLIKRPDTGVVDVLISTSAVSPTLPANYTLARRVGSMKTDGSSQWTKFSQSGDGFLWDTRQLDLSSAATSSTASNLTFSVPTGVVVSALASIRLDYSSAATSTLITSLSEADQAASSSTQTATVSSSGVPATAQINVRTNTARNARVRSSGSGAVLTVSTYGWIDRRGRDG
jgi:hypothetical protein